MKGTYTGSCHCGSIRYAVDIEIADTPARPWSADDRFAWTYRCNCTYCSKTRYWKLFVRTNAFRGLTAATAGEYRFGGRFIRHTFCTTCGTAPYADADFPQMGGAFYAINLASLDDATPAELAALPIRYEDGRNDDWDHEPADHRTG